MNDIRLGVVEARFADIVWSHAPLSTAELVKLCAQALGWKRTTTYTVLKRLSERGIFQNEGGTVTARMSRDEFYSMQSERIVEDSFGGSLPAFMAAFTSRRHLSESDIADIQAMIERMKKG